MVLQYEVRQLLRTVKHSAVDDSEYIHSLSYIALDSEAFRGIDAAELQQMTLIVAALQRVANNRAVAQSAMQRALTAEQLASYLASFDVELSHIEAEYSDDMPAVLSDYAEHIKRGDKYTRIANLFRRAVKRDTHGQTAQKRYLVRAERSYEIAVQMLCDVLELDPQRNPNCNAALASEVARWLDREVDTRDGHQPDITQEGVPRLRGRKSRFSLDEQRAVVGERLRKYWRQREALVAAAFVLMYSEEEFDRQIETAMKSTAQRIAAKLNLVKPTPQPCV